MHVLIIEDNPDIAANLGDYLEDHGDSVGVSGFGQELVEYFKQSVRRKSVGPAAMAKRVLACLTRVPLSIIHKVDQRRG